MTIQRLTAALTVAVWGLVLWIAAGEAQAKAFDPLTEARYVQAVEWWGGVGECTTVTRELVPAAALGGARGDATLATEAGGDCTLRISEALKPCALITTLRHEVGHLRGLGHSEDVDNIMHSPSPDWYCRIEYWKREILQLRRELWEVRRERRGPIKRRNLSLLRYELKQAHKQVRRAEVGANAPHP